MKKLPRVIVTGHDSNYIYPWMLMSKSARENCVAPFKMLIGNLEGALSSIDIEFMKEFADYLEIEMEIFPLEVSPELRKELGRKITYFTPLLFADILSDDFIWLDSDVLCHAGWDSIFEIKDHSQSGQFAVAASKDRGVTIDSLISGPKKPVFISDPERYVNAGVMYFDPVIWKDLGLNLKWVETALSAESLNLDLTFPEQNILNYLLNQSLKLLPSKFNSIAGDVKSEEPLITHYAGYPKPWVLSARGKALYLMTEAINWNRPQFRPSREGNFKTEYFRYWQAEEELLSDLKFNRPDLYEEALRRKRLATREINTFEKIKYAIYRLISLEFRNAATGKKPTLTGIQKQLWADFE